MTDYFSVLGIPANSSVEDAKHAYRRLASKHHPDKGGNVENFKNIEIAMRAIENGFTEIEHAQKEPVPEPVPKSSFTTGFVHRNRIYPKDEFKSKGPLIIPAAIYNSRTRIYSVQLFISKKNGIEGCEVPYRLDRDVVYHHVQAGTLESYAVLNRITPEEILIGKSGGAEQVQIQLTIKD